jgi:hypothetical protein
MSVVALSHLPELLPLPGRHRDSYYLTTWFVTQQGQHVQLGIKTPANATRAYFQGRVVEMQRVLIVQTLVTREEDRRQGAATRVLNWELPMALHGLGFTHIMLQCVGDEHLLKAVRTWPMWREEGSTGGNFVFTI